MPSDISIELVWTTRVLLRRSATQQERRVVIVAVSFAVLHFAAPLSGANLHFDNLIIIFHFIFRLSFECWNNLAANCASIWNMSFERQDARSKERINSDLNELSQNLAGSIEERERWRRRRRGRRAEEKEAGETLIDLIGATTAAA